MGHAAKILKTAQGNPKNVSFADLKNLLVAAGFTLARVSGSHHVYKRPGIPEIVNIQPHGSKAKPYQVRQVADLIQKHAISVE